MIVLFSDNSNFEIFVFLGLNMVLNIKNSFFFFLLIEGNHFSDFGVSFTVSLQLLLNTVVVFL